MSTCNRLDLQTLGSQPIMPKNLPDHWSGWHAYPIFSIEIWRLPQGTELGIGTYSKPEFDKMFVVWRS